MTVIEHALSTRLVIATTCASLVCAGLVLAPSPVQAAPAEEEVAPVEQDEAEVLYRRGQAKYETADFAGAIELWTEAYALVESTPENATIKALLLYNLAQAHVKAHELDEDAIHLKQALQLLENFKVSVDVLYEDEAARAEEHERVEAKIAEVEAKIAELEAAEPEPEPEPEPPPPVVQPPSGGDTGPVNPKPGTPLIAAGGAVAGLGLVFGAVGIVGAIMGANANDLDGLNPSNLEAREDQFRRGRTGNALALAGAVIGGILLPTGVALIAVGAVRNKRAKQGQLSLTPVFTGEHAGLSIAGRF